MRFRIKTALSIPAISSLLILTSWGSGVQTDLGIQVIPRPVRVATAPGHFVISPSTRILFASEAARPAAVRLQAILEEESRHRLEISPGGAEQPEDTILLCIDKRLVGHGPEHYQLDVSAAQVTLSAASPAGLVNGVCTLQQLLPIRTILGLPDRWISWRLPCCTIEDYPRFSWRGVMLDCSRTFQSMEYLKKTIDRMAFYKLNVLHLHLTDDQGWRLEIKKYPELTGQGARFPAHWDEPAGHHGFYTQAEMRALVTYAAARNITIVPEIEMPGHCLAVLACYPDLSCTGGPFEIHPFFKGPGIHQDVFCAGNDQVFTFLEDVLTEVMEIFPSETIHIGGDEVPKQRWKECPKCQARMTREGLKDTHELQSWFIRRMQPVIQARGRRLIGWDEILEGGLAPHAAVMSWRGTRGGLTAARAGHDVVMSPTSHCYFDYSYDRIDTVRAWSFDPIAGLDTEQARHVLGVQANFWSHIDREADRVDHQLFPRLLGTAECGWSPAESRDQADFQWRENIHLAHLDELGVAYRRTPTPLPGRDPQGRWQAPVPETYGPISWDVTEHIDGPGTYRVLLQYTHGSHRLGIEQVDLLAGDEVVASDAHRGETGSVHQQNTYRLVLPTVTAGVGYHVRARARSEGGTDSNGQMFLEKE